MIACSECGTIDGHCEEVKGLREIIDKMRRSRGQKDTRWRPMHSAPRDGTVIELRWSSMSNFGRYEDGWLVGDTYFSTPDCWRPAHPEWNEEG